MLSRRLAIFLPILLVLGIAAQVVLLVLAIVFWPVLVIWPHIVDIPARWITRGFTRTMIRGLTRRKATQP
jgi:hypothetical protein